MSRLELLRKQSSKIAVNQTQRKEHISLSWKYMTVNKNHTFEYFQKDMRKEVRAWRELSELIRHLNQSTWQNALSVSKYQKYGAETLESSCLKFSPKDYTFTSDQKVIVFRFGQGNDYRLIGVKGTDSNILYVIGYDFDFTAYNHGS